MPKYRICNECNTTWPALECILCPQCGTEDTDKVYTEPDEAPPYSKKFKGDLEEDDFARVYVMQYVEARPPCSLSRIIRGLRVEHPYISETAVRSAIFHCCLMGLLKEYHGKFSIHLRG